MQADRQRAKQIVEAVFFEDIKGDIGKLARHAVPSADKRAIVDRVEREIVSLRAEILTKSNDARGT